MTKLTLSASLSLLLIGSAGAQALDGVGAPPAPVEKHGLPGKKPGTERWIVTFKSRSFDLREFRAATIAGDARRVATIVADLEKKVRADQAPFAEALGKLDGEVVDRYWIINGCAIEVPFKNLGALRHVANVLKIEPDEVVLPFVKESTNSANHNSDAANANGFKGAGIATAIMDTGLDENCGTKGRPNRTFFPEGDLTKTHRLKANRKIGAQPADNAHPHGTGVASIVAGGNWGSANGDNGHAPLADIVGYSIADTTSGGSQFTTIVRGWQAIAADAAQFKIKTANNSYSGSPDPTHASQQALDSAALNADIMVIVAAGNNGSSTAGSQSCANGLTAAAVQANTHAVAGFSSRGPLSGDTQRFYPDLSGLGVSRRMARVDNESTDYVASGTSFGSPNVCGTATLVRAQDTSMRAVEAKAVLLASALDISGKNRTLNRNAYGMGLVKSDNATNLVTTGSGRGYGLQKLTATTKTWTKVLVTQSGKSYRFAAAWMRHNLTQRNWSNIDLEILRGTTVVASSKTSRNLYEVAGFTSQGGAYVARITAVTLEDNKDLDVGWAFTEGQAPPVIGTFETFGTGCQGTGRAPAGGPISPKAYITKWGESANTFPHGRANMRYQQLHSSSDFSTFLVTGIAFRLDERFGGGAGTPSVEILMGYSSNTPANMSTTFATNVKANTRQTSVFKGTMNYPAHTGNNNDLKKFDVKVPFTRPWPYQPATGNLMWEFVNSGPAVTHFFDWARNSTTTRRMWAFATNAATGRLDTTNAGLVTQFLTPGGTGAVPQLDASAAPELGQSFDVTLSFAKPNTAAGLIQGVSKTQWGAINLPFKLDPLGAPNCSLFVSFDFLLATPTDSNGNGKVTYLVPNDKALISQQLHYQFLVLDNPQGNTLGVVMTNGGTATIGGQP